MRYTFPHISHISQCLKAIEGSPEFVVAERDRHTIINYIMMGNDTFPPVMAPKPPNPNTCAEVGRDPYPDLRYDIDAAIRRECRGIVFGPDGRVIARRLHKFFNAGERPEVAVPSIDFSRDHVVLEKLDGSMITPIPIGDHVRWGTKMGLTSVGFQAEEFVSARKDYVGFARFCIDLNFTPIFEWVSRKQRIVVDYPRDDLILLAVRHNVTGAYVGYEKLKAHGVAWNIPVVSRHPGKVEDGEAFIDGVVNNQHDGLMEGFVVRFDDGHSVKVKTADYVRIHRAKDSIRQEKRVVEMIVNDKVDDVIPHLIDHDRDALTRFRDDFVSELTEVVDAMWTLYGVQYKTYAGVKGDFARASGEMLRELRATIFAVWGKTEKAEAYEHLKGLILKNLGSATRVDGVRWLWGNLRWSDYITEEESA